MFGKIRDNILDWKEVIELAVMLDGGFRDWELGRETA